MKLRRLSDFVCKSYRTHHCDFISIFHSLDMGAEKGERIKTNFQPQFPGPKKCSRDNVKAEQEFVFPDFSNQASFDGTPGESENAFPQRPTSTNKRTHKQQTLKLDHELLRRKLLALQIDTYEQNCDQLFKQKRSPSDNNEAESAAKGLIGYDDIPWPYKEDCNLNGVEDFLFGDLKKGSADYKTYLRQQQVRWHPDRFLHRCGDRLLESQKQRIIDKVKELSQILNRLSREMQF